MHINSHARPAERGSTIYMFLFCLIIVFLVLGISVDLGMTYVGRSALSKAVDAGVLAGVRFTNQGHTAMKDQAVRVAKANYPESDGLVYYDAQVTTPFTDATRLRMTASTGRNTYFAKLMGQTAIDVNVAAAATRHPIDLSMLLDISQSMSQSGSFPYLKDAAKDFLEFFDDTVDQIGMVTFSTYAEEQMPLQKNFTAQGQSIINGLSTQTDTNPQEAFRLSKNQMDAAPQRTTARKVVVLVTDGLPTAYRDDFELLDPFCADFDGVIAAWITGSLYRGLFSFNDGRKLLPHILACNPKNWASNTSSLPSPLPAYILHNAAQLNVDGNNVRDVAKDKALAKAAELRAAGYKIYTIVIDDPQHPSLLSQVLQFADDVVDQSGSASLGLAPGKVFYAENPSDIDEVFIDVANSIVAQLTE